MPVLFFLSALIASCLAAPINDLVTNLPGFGVPLAPLYSGYLTAGTGQYLHYVYTAPINANVSSAPLVIFFNGGPGCSSMEGLLSESGPYKIDMFSDPPSFSFNPYTWQNETHGLWIESPAGVGFSYCEKSAGCTSSDTSSAENNLKALQSFYNAFPELLPNSLVITGESYAGIYVPMLAYNVYKANIAKTGPIINLKGIMVGNGCIGNAAGHCGNDPLNNLHDVTTLRGHGLISQALYDSIIKECNWDFPSLVCDALVADAELLSGFVDVYDLYNTCPDPASPEPPRLRAPVGNTTLLARRFARLQQQQQQQQQQKTLAITPRNGALPPDPNCFESGPTIENWANQAQVKAALHVAPGIDFALCSNNFTFNYNSDMPDERVDIYPTLIDDAKIKVTIFNGEADLCVPFTDNEWWTSSMNYSVAKGWGPWEVEGSHGSYLGGMRVVYGVNSNFVFATVRGAGHMCAATKPEATLELFNRAVLGKGF